MAQKGRPPHWFGSQWKLVDTACFRHCANVCLCRVLSLYLTHRSSAAFFCSIRIWAWTLSICSFSRSFSDWTVCFSPSWALAVVTSVSKSRHLVGGAGGEQSVTWQGPEGSTLFHLEALTAVPTCLAGSFSCLLPRPACSGLAAAPWTASSSETSCSPPRLQPEKWTQQCVK